MAENHMQLIAEKMLQLGIPANLKGYHYLRSSIIRCIENPEVATSVTKLLYPDVAKEFKTTSEKVEHAIQNAIETGWERGDSYIQDEIFGYSNLDEGDKTTNSEFIAIVADAIRLQTR